MTPQAVKVETSMDGISTPFSTTTGTVSDCESDS
jgi:hypothetical protein